VLFRSDVIAAVASASADFEEAVLLAAEAGEPSEPARTRLIEQTRSDLAKVGEEARTAAWGGKRAAVLEAEALARRRAYVLPVDEVRLEAARCVEELTEWSVPSSVLENLKSGLLAQITEKGAPVARMRAAFFRLLDDYDYWSWYIDWYASRSRIVCILCVVAAVVSLVLAGFIFLGHPPVIGFLLAGLAGTLVSIAIKMPTLIVYGEASAYTIRVLGRLATGLAASVIGGALLVSGIVTLPLGTSSKTLAEMMEACHGAEATQCTSAASSTQPAASQPADGGLPTPRKQASIGTAPVKGDKKSTPPTRKCPDTWVLVLIGMGMLFGFSERSLTRFEGRIFPESGERPKKQDEKPAAPTNPQGQPGANDGSTGSGT
jgi:hypothetical protein